MICRVWRGRATAEKAEAYRRHVTETVFPKLPGLGGHRGACLLTRAVEGEVEFLAVTFWDSLEAVKAFAGDNPDIANVEPAARAVLSDFDDYVRHFDVAQLANWQLGAAQGNPS